MTLITIISLSSMIFSQHNHLRHDKPVLFETNLLNLFSGDTVIRSQTSIHSVESCSTFFDLEAELFDYESKDIYIIQLSNSLVYIEKNGLLNLNDGRIHAIDKSSATDQSPLYRQLKDSIICIRTETEQHIFNLLSGYRYHKERWASGLFRSPGVVESYSGNIVPIFKNDSTLNLVDVRSNRIVNKLSQGQNFHPNISKSHDYWFAGNKKRLYKLRAGDGSTELSIHLEGGLGSNVVLYNGMIICWDIKRGVVAFDSISGNLAWVMKSDYKGAFVKLILDDDKIYFNDGRLKSILAESGALVWENRTDENITRNNNLILAQNYLVTGFSHDKDAVVALIDKNSGDIVCNGFYMSDHIGFDRYTFFDSRHQPYFYAREGGGLGYKIVRLKIKK